MANAKTQFVCKAALQAAKALIAEQIEISGHVSPETIKGIRERFQIDSYTHRDLGVPIDEPENQPRARRL